MSKATWTSRTAPREVVERKGRRRGRRGEQRRRNRPVSRWARGEDGCGETGEVERGRPPRTEERRVQSPRRKKSLLYCRGLSSCAGSEREWMARGRRGRRRRAGERRSERLGSREDQAQGISGK